MALDVTETIMSAFSDLASTAGLAAVVGPVVLLVLWMITGGLFMIGGAIGVILGLAGAVVSVAAQFAFMVGIFRAFRKQELKLEYFTSNFGWPAFRMLIVNTVMQGILFMVTYALFIPLLLIGVGMGGLMALGGGAMTGSMLSSMGGGLLIPVMGTVILAVAVYVFTALVLAVPIIPIEDKRAFQALDEAIQRSKGERARMFATALPVVALGALGYYFILAGGSAVMALTGFILLFIAGVYNISLLNQLAGRLQ